LDRKKGSRVSLVPQRDWTTSHPSSAWLRILTPIAPPTVPGKENPGTNSLESLFGQMEKPVVANGTLLDLRSGSAKVNMQLARTEKSSPSAISRTMIQKWKRLQHLIFQCGGEIGKILTSGGSLFETISNRHKESPLRM